MGYLTNFIVYTLAMVGVIMLAVLIFKSTSCHGIKGGAKNLKVLDTLSLGPRKTLYIVSAGEEKFLIAGDVDRTTLISKLGINKKNEVEVPQQENFKETMQNLSLKTSYMDKTSIGIYKTQKKPYESVMKSLAERIKG